ncbi:hypothetical protein ACC771_10290, partial [Rhizobium ruizarguesonis]
RSGRGDDRTPRHRPVDGDAMSKAGVVHHKPSMKSVLLRGAFIIIALYIALYVVYVVQQPRALGAGAITSLINNTVPLALASAGQAIVVLSRGFDLSLASDARAPPGPSSG